jgi:hypothetical protein
MKARLLAFAGLLAGVILAGAIAPPVRLEFDGHWEIVRGRHDGRFGDASARSFHPGDAMIMQLSGTGFRIFGITGPNGGRGIVLLADRPDREIDFYSPYKRTDVVVYTSPPGRYRFAALVVARTHDARSRGTYVNVDNVEAMPTR